MSIRIDLSDFKEFQQRVSELDKSEVDEFCETEAKNIAEKLLELATAATPVDTGFLRRGWTIEAGSSSNSVKVVNGVFYAPYVEFGHRTRSGTFVEGRHFLEKSETQISDEIPSYLKGKVENFLLKGFG